MFFCRDGKGKLGSELAMAEQELPDECWEIIFSRLTHPAHWQSLSLTCRRFLFLSNRMRPSISISNSSSNLLRLLHRFTAIHHIDFSTFHGNLARPLTALAQSCPHLETLTLHGQKALPLEALSQVGHSCKKLTRLNCSRLHLLQDEDLIAIAASFPGLQDLDLSYPQNGFRPPIGIVLCPGVVTDTGVEAIAAGLAHLRSINISGHYMLSDFSLQALAMGCRKLQEILVFDCPFVTDKGLELLGIHCSSLKALAVNGPRISSLGIGIFLSRPIKLLSLDLSHMNITDELLFQIGELHVPLKKLVLARCKGLTSGGILCLVRGCPQITHLNLEGAHCLRDEDMASMAELLKDLCFICLNYCSMLTDASFFSLLGGCPHLEELDMESTGLGWGTVNVSSMQTCRHLQKLKLAWNKAVGDITLQWIGKVCPSLLSLDLSHCLFVTDAGIAAIGRGCPYMKELTLKGCKRVHNMGRDAGFEQLEYLDLEASGVMDVGLQTLGKNCRHLLCLGLQGCVQITGCGLKKLMEDCKKLREINLTDCQGVNIDALAWMVFDRPSLRKLMLPSSGISEGQKRRMMRHGCELSCCRNC